MFGEAVLAYVIGLSVHQLAVILTGALARIWRDGEAISFSGIIDSSDRKGVATWERLAV